MTKPPNGTVPFDSSDLTQLKKKKRKPQRRKPEVSSANPATRAPPVPPFGRKIRGGWDGRKEGTNCWLGWTNQQLPHVYLCSLQDLVLARAQRGDADLRSMPCLQECVRGFSLQTELIISQFPIPTCHILSTNKPCFVRYCVCGGPLLCLRTKLPYFFTLLLSSFWTSRGHRCRPFSPPVLAFNFYRA